MEHKNSFLILFLAPVKEFLEDDSVSEILINGPEQIYIERRGKLERTEAKFPSEPSLRAAASNIAKSVQRLLNDDYPRLDARLPDGSRVHAVIPPLSRLARSLLSASSRRTLFPLPRCLTTEASPPMRKSCCAPWC